MMFLKLSLNTLLYILVMTMASSIENAGNLWHSVDYHRLSGLTSLHYSLKLSLIPSYISHGESNITIHIHGPTRDITLLTSAYINVTSVNLISLDNEKIYVPRCLYSSNDKDNIVLNFTEQLLPENSFELGFYILYVNFTNFNPKEFPQTWYTDEKEDNMFVATFFQPTQNRPLFPYLNISESATTFKILVEHGKRYKVLSNMPIKNQSMSNDKMLTYFHTYPLTSIYEVALILMSSDMTPSDPIRYDPYLSPFSKIIINTWSRSRLVPYMKFTRHILKNVTRHLEDTWKILKRGPKIDYVFIPNFEGNIRQTWGFLLYNETYITYNEEKHSVQHKSAAIHSIAHNIISQWFGGLFYSYKHWWLNEGFIKFVEAYVIDKVFPNCGMMNLSIIQDMHEYRYMDIHFPSDIYGNITNNTFKINSLSIRQRIKGPIVWRMLKEVIPNNVFWKSIYLYLIRGATCVNSRIPDNLWDIMQTTIDKSEIKNYELNVKRMMNVWAEQKYCPVVNATRDYNSEGDYITISIDKKQLFNQTTFFIPISYTTEKNNDFNTSSAIDYYLTESNPELKIPIRFQNLWVIVNKQKTGYYRINYDTNNWRRVGTYLNLNYTNIPVLIRAQIVDDAFYFALEKRLHFDRFINLGYYLVDHEQDYTPWYSLFKAFECLSNYFAIFNIPDMHLLPGLKRISVLIKGMFDNKLRHIYPYLFRWQFVTHHPMKPVDDDFTTYLKMDIRKWGCLINDTRCIWVAEMKLVYYLQNQKFFNISTGWEEWTYCNGLKRVNASIWNSTYLLASRMYKEKSDYKMLNYLGCSENSSIIVKYLWSVIPEFKKDMLRENDYKMLTQKDKDKIDTLINTNMFLSTLARHAKNTLVLKEILKNYERYYKDSPVSMTSALIVLINNAYTHKQLFREIGEFARKVMPPSNYEFHIKNKLTTRYDQVSVQMQFFNNLFENKSDNEMANEKVQ
ncbi:glutamyl aminopeptidase-like [Nylanderia fulva]|uniref:glutamyl aminopeptidase-like n=1 Tax=Nylanderia fulva TaxID=613905 RepID=UPI0010FB0BFA|nr:glutamyl aminopeptidase-like [Nylanderia fulva]